MNNKINKRKKLGYLILFTGILFLLLGNTLAWIYLQRIQSFFESDLKFRLENIVQISSKLIDAAFLNSVMPGEENDPEIIFYQQLLFDIKEKNNLQDIYIISPVGDLLIDVNPNYEIGGIKKSVNPVMLEKALAGQINSSDIYTLGQHKFLSAAIPLFDDSNLITGILITEARADFFTVIEEFNNGLVIFSIINIIVVFAAAFFVYRSMKTFIDLQNQIKDQEHLVQLGEMAASVAHEIRNPLGIIKGTNDLILKKYGQSEDDFFKYIPLELDRLNKLINDFLSFSKKIEIKFERVELDSFIKKILIGFDQKNIEFLFHNKSEIDSIVTDINILEQVILNTIQNSIQAINGHGKIEIDVYQPNKKQFVLTIKDNGKGIRPEIIKNVFEPFYSTKEKGSGLGLAISKRLIEQIGGTISIESENDLGTKVNIILPFKN